MRLQPILEVVDRVGDALSIQIQIDERFPRNPVFRLVLQILAKLDRGRVGILHVRGRLVFRDIHPDERVADHAIQFREARIDRAGFLVVLQSGGVLFPLVGVICIADFHPRLHL
jgi:hypothetical protein